MRKKQIGIEVASATASATSTATATAYRRELKARLCSVSGWLFIAINILAVGICSAVMNVLNGYENFEYALELASLSLIFTAPFLAACSIARERKSGELEMLVKYTEPEYLLIGKYLAWLTLFAPCVLICAIVPPILSGMGEVFMPSAYVGIIGYLLFGAAILALCLYISCSSSRSVICFFSGLGAVLVLNVLSNTAQVISASNITFFIVIAMAFIALITVVLFFSFEKTAPMVIFAVSATVLTLILSYFGLLDNAVRGIIAFISPQYSLSLFMYGRLELRAIIQLICFTLIFLALSVMKLKIIKYRAK